MNNINFEGIGINLNINPVLIEILGIKIYWYGFLIILAIIIGLIFCKIDDGKYDIEFDDILELILITVPISIIFARLYFVLFNLAYYLSNPIEIINIRNGGLAIYGGIIGAIISIFGFSKRKKIDILDLTDFLIPYLALGQSIGRWGNLFNVEAYGTETNSILRMGIFDNGKYMQVHPTFLYESICTFIIFLILFNKRNKRDYPGQLTYWYFFLYGISRSIIEGLRVDSLMMGNIRVSQLISILLALSFGIVLMCKKVKK